MNDAVYIVALMLGARYLRFQCKFYYLEVHAYLVRLFSAAIK